MFLLTTEEWEVLDLSLRVAVCCVVVSLPPGVYLGWVLPATPSGA